MSEAITRIQSTSSKTSSQTARSTLSDALLLHRVRPGCRRLPHAPAALNAVLQGVRRDDGVTAMDLPVWLRVHPWGMPVRSSRTFRAATTVIAHAQGFGSPMIPGLAGIYTSSFRPAEPVLVHDESRLVLSKHENQGTRDAHPDQY
jgi:hypothetical protein